MNQLQRHVAAAVGEDRSGNLISERLGSKAWLGTYDTVRKAAKTCDRVAFKMLGSKVIINFPFEARKCQGLAMKL
ncbi:hypothetical protein Vadar_007975 [Vaccinium darrowii]|uniref:Uncharacterized protein n=1 Tax=Vaccinium darrowii TaxID=229202 RepID=A0ACB7XXP7_9ERIC|nr:hypothetical protein Vadar_007975 [Vaccinium darrowii]